MALVLFQLDRKARRLVEEAAAELLGVGVEGKGGHTRALWRPIVHERGLLGTAAAVVHDD